MAQNPHEIYVRYRQIKCLLSSAVCLMPDRQKGSSPIITIVSLLALAMVILGSWWGLVMVPKNQAAKDHETHIRIESLVASKSFLFSPSSKLSCDAVGGTWQLGQNALSTGSIVTRQPGKNTPTSCSRHSATLIATPARIVLVACLWLRMADRFSTFQSGLKPGVPPAPMKLWGQRLKFRRLTAVS